MEKRDLKLQRTRNKNGKGSTSLRYMTNVPTTWAKAIGVTEDDRDITVSFDGKRIIIEKAPS